MDHLGTISFVLIIVFMAILARRKIVKDQKIRAERLANLPAGVTVPAGDELGPDCRQCGAAMVRHRFSEGNIRVLLGLLVVILGFWLIFVVPVFGWVVGLIMVVVGLGMGGKRRKGWRCMSCGYFFDAR